MHTDSCPDTVRCPQTPPPPPPRPIHVAHAPLSPRTPLQRFDVDGMTVLAYSAAHARQVAQ